MAFFKNLILVGFLACLMGFVVEAQDYIYDVRHFGVEDGLIHREVNAIFKDSRGYLWLGTRFGLSRFDGYGFKSWTKEIGGLEDNSIVNIAEDAAEYLWLIHKKGSEHVSSITLFNPDLDEIISFEEKFGSGLNLDIWDLFEQCIQGPDGTLYFGSKKEGALISYHPDHGLDQLKIPDIKNFQPVAYANENSIWGIADGNTLIELDKNGKKKRVFTHENQLVAQREDQIPGFYYSEIKPSGPLIFFISPEGNRESTQLHKYSDSGQLEFSSYQPFPLQMDSLVFINGKIVHLRKGILKEGLLKLAFEKNNNIRSVLLDQSGTLVVGNDFGFSMLSIQSNRFDLYLSNTSKEQQSLSSVRGMVKVGNTLVANLEILGLHQVDLTTNETLIKTYLQKSDWGWYAIGLVDQGKILVSQKSNLFTLSFKPGHFEILGKRQIPEQSRFIWSIYKAGSGNLWFGTEEGLSYSEKNDDRIMAFNRYNGFPKLSIARILFIGADREGNIRICANSGFYTLDEQDGITSRYWTGGESGYKLPADDIQHFYQDEEGIFWLASSGAGLIRLDEKEKSVKAFNKKDGFPNNNIYGIYEDKDNRLWMSSDYGLIVLDKVSKKVESYTKEDGISHNEFNRISHYQDNEGRLYFGSLNGITAFLPDDFTPSSVDSEVPLVITGFRQFDGESNQLQIKTSELIQTKRITLYPEDRFFSLEVALLSLKEADKIQYAWKIEGVDKDWNYQKERSIRLSRLPYGEHKLRIKGQEADGRWSSRELEILICVLRPFYSQAWFVFLGILIFLAAGPIFYYSRIQIHKKRQEELKILVKERTKKIQRDKQTIEKQAQALKQIDSLKSRFFANVSHELRTPLTLILGPVKSVLKRNKLENQDFTYLKMMEQNAKHLLSLVNEILDLGKLESGNLELNKTPEPLYPLAQRLVSGFESHAQNQGKRLLFEYNADRYMEIMIDVAKFEKIFNNLISNAIKFAPKEGEVTVSFEDTGSKIVLKVKDTGKGIHPDDLPHIFDRYYQSRQPNADTQGGTGIGLAICKEFASLLGGEITVKSKYGKGSMFTFHFPKVEVMGASENTGEDQLVLSENDKIEQIKESNSHQSNGLLGFSDVLEQSNSAGLKSTILIVEDNQSLCQYLQLILSPEYDLLIAANGQEALESLEDGEAKLKFPDLIMSDVMMPVMDGFELLKILKSKNQFRRIPVIMLTAKAGIQDKLNALRIGVDDYIIKPFEEDELLVRISNLLKNYRERLKFFQKGETSALKHVEPLSPSLDPVSFSEKEYEWLAELEETVKSNIVNRDFTTEFLSHEMALSRSSLNRQIKRLTGMTPNAYIQGIRLDKARNLLETHKFSTVKSVAYEVGFKDVEYFSKLFKKHFGVLPSGYLK